MTLKQTISTFVATALLTGSSIAMAQTATATRTTSGVAAGVTLPRAPVYALTSDNAIYVLRQGASQYVRLGRVKQSTTTSTRS